MKHLVPTIVCTLAAWFLIPVDAALPAARADEATTLPHRSWQFQDADWDHLQKVIPQAKAAGMNRIQLSHDIVMDAEELWEGDGADKRLDLVRNAADLAKSLGLQVDMWTHELSGVPRDKFRDPATGKPILSPELWQWLTDKYEHLFELVPALDGLVLTFAETDHSVYKDAVVSDLPKAQRVAKLIGVMADVCAKHHKLLIVRTFVYEPREIEAIREALAEVAKTEAQTHNIIVMTKCVPHDWTPYYPFNPLLGNAAGLPQVFEIDLGQEFTGLSKILHGEVDYVKYVVDYAREKGVIGGVARVERMNNHALGTPNEVNIHAFSRLLHEPKLTADELWSEWAKQRYGEAAAPHVIRALRRTFDITNLTYFPLEQWVVNHSRVPDWSYAHSHITSRQNFKWIPSPRQIAARDELLRPTRDTLVKIESEKNLARQLSDLSLADLEQARPLLKEADYGELRRYLDLGRDNVEVFRQHNLAMFSLLHLQARLKAGDASAEELAALREVVASHINGLRTWAKEMETRYGQDVCPGNPQRLRIFADEIEKRLGK